MAFALCLACRLLADSAKMTVGNAGRDLCIYLLMLPALDFFMSSPKIIGRPGNKQRGAMVGLAVLGGISAVKVGFELMTKEASYYDMLDVLPGVPSSELKKGYKRASLKVHPDKIAAQAAAGSGDAELDAESADEAFVALKAAYDVLSDTQKRDLYDKFGKPGLDFDGSDTSKLFTGLGFFYVMWLALAYLLTRRKTYGRAQTWSFTGLMALAIFEYQACIAGLDFLQDALPQLAMFEKVELLHRVYPVYLLGARMVAWLLYEDLDAHAFVMLQQLHWKVDRVRERLAIMAHNGASGASSSAAAPLPEIGADGAITAEMWAGLAKANVLASQAIQAQSEGVSTGAAAGAASGGEQAAAAAGGAAEAAGAAALDAAGGGAIASGMAPVAKAPVTKAAAAGGGRSVMSLVYFFGVYFFFQWLVGRGS